MKCHTRKTDPAGLEQPLANIERWLDQGRLQKAPLLKSCSPLPGLLSEAELEALNANA